MQFIVCQFYPNKAGKKQTDHKTRGGKTGEAGDRLCPALYALVRNSNWTQNAVEMLDFNSSYECSVNANAKQTKKNLASCSKHSTKCFHLNDLILSFQHASSYYFYW